MPICSLSKRSLLPSLTVTHNVKNFFLLQIQTIIATKYYFKQFSITIQIVSTRDSNHGLWLDQPILTKNTFIYICLSNHTLLLQNEKVVHKFWTTFQDSCDNKQNNSKHIMTTQNVDISSSPFEQTDEEITICNSCHKFEFYQNFQKTQIPPDDFLRNFFIFLVCLNQYNLWFLARSDLHQCYSTEEATTISKV